MGRCSLRKDKYHKELSRLERTIAGEQRGIHEEMFNLSTQVDQLTRDNQELNLRNTKLLDENLYYSKQLLESRELIEELQANRVQRDSALPHDQSSNELILDSSTQYGDSPFKLENGIEIEHKTPISKGDMSRSRVNIELYRSINTPILEEDAKDRAIAEYLDIIQKQSEMIEQLKLMKAPTLIHTRKGSMATAGFIDLHESTDSIHEKENYRFGRKGPKSRYESFHNSNLVETKVLNPSKKNIAQFNISAVSGVAIHGSALPTDLQSAFDNQAEPVEGHHRGIFKKQADTEHPDSPSLGKSVKFMEPYKDMVRSQTIGTKNEESRLAEIDSQHNEQADGDHGDPDQHPQDQDDSFAVDHHNDEVRSSQGDMMAHRKQLLNNSSEGELDNQRYTRAATIHGSKMLVIADFDQLRQSHTDAKKDGFQKVKSHKTLRPRFDDKSRVQGLIKKFSKLQRSGALSADYSRDYLGIQERPRIKQLLNSIGDKCTKVYSDLVGFYKSPNNKLTLILVATSRRFPDSRYVAQT